MYPVAEIKEYDSTSQITEKIDKEIATTKTTLGEYLRQLDDVRYLAVNKKDKKREQIDVNGFEIVVDATLPNELKAMESVVRSYSQRLTTLKMAQESLKEFEQFSDLNGVKYLVLEKEGVPERVLVKT